MTTAPTLPRLGVLGGMGPLATVDFMRKLILGTPGTRDQDHLPVIAYSVPQIPDRSEAFLNGSDAPWPYLLEGLRTLEHAGAQAIAIPCNTAHVWHARLAMQSSTTILHIGRSACGQIAARLPRGSRVGVLATSATLAARIYHDELEAAGMTVVEPDAATQREAVMRGIRAVKAGELAHGAALLLDAARSLERAGVAALLLACTEIPLALAGAPLAVPTIDPTAALAHACIAWWQRACAAGSSPNLSRSPT
ncbi:aspartate/glutamate racemase family protein [Paraburkholderia sp.]|uniref:aspartate/glutamate racemase family protein n=1 Tax=Paraburkholderia sp. TaxID=1926495 RepID=UPI0039E28CA4